MAVPAPTTPNGMTPPVARLAHSPAPMALDPTPGSSSATPVPTAAASAPPSTENPVAYTQWLLSIIKSASGAPHDSGSPTPAPANSGAAHALPTPTSLNGSHGSLPSLLAPAPPSLLDLASRLPSDPPNVPTNMSRPAHPPAGSSLTSDASHHPPSLLDPYRPPSAAGIHPLLGTPSVTSSSSYIPQPPLPHATSSPARPSTTAAAPPAPITEAQVLLLVAQAVRPLQEMQSMLVQSSHAASARLDLLDAEIRSVRTDMARIPPAPTPSSSAASDAAVRLLHDDVTALKEVLANERVDHAVLKHEVAAERAELARTLQAVKAERDELVALKEALRKERAALADLRERLEVEKTVAKVWSLIEDAPAAAEVPEARMGAVATPIPAAPAAPRVPPSEPGSPPVQIIGPRVAPPPPLVAVDPDPMLVDTPVPPAGFNAHVQSPTAPRHPNEATLAQAMDLGLPPPTADAVAPPELVAAPAAPPRDDVPAKPKRNQQQHQQRGDGQKARRGRGTSSGTNSNRISTNNQRKQNQARSKDRTGGGDANDGKKPLIDRYIPPTSSRARAQRDLPPPPRRPHDTDLRDQLPPRQYTEDLRDQLSMPRRDRDHRDHRDREHPWRRAAIDTSPPPKRRRSLSPLPRPPPGPPPPLPPRDAYRGGGPELDHAPQFGPDDIPDDAAYLVDYARGGRRGSVVHINPNHHAYRGNAADPYATAGYTDASAAGYYASPQPQPPVPPSGAPPGLYDYYQGYYDDAGFPAGTLAHAHPPSHPPPPPPDDLSALLDDDGGIEPPTAAMDVARLSEMLRAVQAASAGLQGGGSAEGM
ncbi:hypothetical protein GGF32_006621 [Allomyces javanicus]|nr:hypothetical protein GGF32_006621 [Allomyces javanicus]